MDVSVDIPFDTSNYWSVLFTAWDENNAQTKHGPLSIKYRYIKADYSTLEYHFKTIMWDEIMSSTPVLTLINAWSTYEYVVYDNIQQIVPIHAPVHKKQFNLSYMHHVLGLKKRLWQVKHAQGSTQEYHKCA